MRKLILNLIRILIFTISVNQALELGKVELADEKTKTKINEYVNQISDIKDKYVINEKLTKIISPYFKHKIDLFPLYKINLKIDRTPIKIPWTLGQPETDTSIKKREYHIETEKSNTTM